VHNGVSKNNADAGDSYTGGGLSTAGTITWDPLAGLNVAAEQGGVANRSPSASPGTESAAILLAHEFAHATDPNYITDANTYNAQYDNNAEAYAVSVEDSIGVPLGEPARYNHTGT
jgi:hypothetical protein